MPSLQVVYVWHASVYTREVLDGLLRIGFLYPQQIIWNKGRTVLTRTHYWYQHEPCWYLRKKNAPWYGRAGDNSTIWDSPSPKFIMGGSKEEKCDHPTQKPIELMRRPILNHTKRGVGAQWFDMGGVTVAEGDENHLEGISRFKRYFSREILEVGAEWVLEPAPLRARIAAAIPNGTERMREWRAKRG